MNRNVLESQEVMQSVPWGTLKMCSSSITKIDTKRKGAGRKEVQTARVGKEIITLAFLPACHWGLPVHSGPTYAGYRSINYVSKHREFLQRAAPWAEDIYFLFPDVQASGKACDRNGN
jgi:hypothetical protein